MIKLAILSLSLLTGVFSSHVSRKKLIHAGIVLYIIGGFGGGLANSIPFLLTMRAVLGIGVGILMPLSTGIIADFYTGDEKMKTMGFSSAATNLGAIITTLLAGILASYHWRASFYIYLLGIPVFLSFCLSFFAGPIGVFGPLRFRVRRAGSFDNERRHPEKQKKFRYAGNVGCQQLYFCRSVCKPCDQ